MRANEMGQPMLLVHWGAPEKAILNRYARAVIRGRYRSARQATRDCMVELAHLHRLHRDTRWGRWTRSRFQIRDRLQDRLRALEIPRAGGGWTPGERTILKRFTKRCVTRRRGAVSGAARACVRELERSYRRERRRTPWLPHGQPRTFRAVKQLLVELRNGHRARS